MDSRQLAFITDKLPHQSVSVVNDLETESSDSRINYLSVAKCKRKQGKCCRSFQSS